MQTTANNNPSQLRLDMSKLSHFLLTQFAGLAAVILCILTLTWIK